MAMAAASGTDVIWNFCKRDYELGASGKVN